MASAGDDNLAEIIGGKYGEGGQLEWRVFAAVLREICFSRRARNLHSKVNIELNEKTQCRLATRLLCAAAPNGSPRHEWPKEECLSQTANLDCMSDDGTHYELYSGPELANSMSQARSNWNLDAAFSCDARIKFAPLSLIFPLT